MISQPNEMLASAKGRMATLIMKLEKLHVSNQKSLFCFVEGDDDHHYYIPRIKNETDFNNIIHFCCEGKSNVIQISRMIEKSEKYKDLKAAYFVDKDFDDNVQMDQIYVTPYYAFENFYVTVSSFQNILESIFSIHPGNANYKEALDLFIKNQQNFNESVTWLNAFICYSRKFKPENKLNLDRIPCSKLYNIQLYGSEPKYNREDISDTFKGCSIDDKDGFEKIYNEFESCDEKHLIFRGKYELDFLCNFLNHLIEEYNRCKERENKSTVFTYNEFTKTIKYEIKKTKDKNNSNLYNWLQFIIDMSQYAETPHCLKEYLHQINEKYKEVS